MKVKFFSVLAMLFVMMGSTAMLAYSSDYYNYEHGFYKFASERRMFTLEEVEQLTNQAMLAHSFDYYNYEHGFYEFASERRMFTLEEVEQLTNQDNIIIQPRFATCCNNMRIVVSTGWGCVVGNNGRCVGIEMQWRTYWCANSGSIHRDILTGAIRECRR